MISNSPLISVCMPTYNYAGYIREAVDSVLGQGFADFELIIVDDCSSDNTEEIVTSYNDSRIRFLRNTSNVGMVPNWNYSLNLARGKYVKFLFADDFLVSGCSLQKMSDILENSPEVALVGSSRHIVDSKSVVLKTVSYCDKDIVIDGYGAIAECLKKIHNLIGEPSAVMFRRSDAMRGFDPRFRQLVDLEMWFHILEKGKFAFVHEPLCSFRVHDQQQTAVNRERPETIYETGMLHEKYLGNPQLQISSFAKWYIATDYTYRVRKAFGSSGKKKRLQNILSMALYKTIKPFVKLINRENYRNHKMGQTLQ